MHEVGYRFVLIDFVCSAESICSTFELDEEASIFSERHIAGQLITIIPPSYSNISPIASLVPACTFTIASGKSGSGGARHTSEFVQDERGQARRSLDEEDKFW